MLPVLSQPIESMQTKALDAILSGDSGGASRVQATMIKIMEGYLRQLTPKSLSPALYADWIARTNAILTDLRLAAATP